MSESSSAPQPAPGPSPEPAPSPATASVADLKKRASKDLSRIFLVSYPKIVFLYPTFLAAVVAAVCLSFYGSSPDAASRGVVLVNTIFLGVLAANLVILAFDFPRATSLTLFFLGLAVLLGCLLLFRLQPELLPTVTAWLAGFHPAANAVFYWTVVCILGAIFLGVLVLVRFDYWEVRPNELLHHHGLLSDLERLAAPNLRIDKEINDVFEYLLLRSGRLVLHASNERRAIILDNVPFIEKKEVAITRMLGALQVQVRSEDADH